MSRVRVIPCLLLKGSGLVKTVKFRKPRYVGDPINAVRIFNDKEVDELIFLDITATVEDRPPPLKKITEIAGECFMPLCYGGGVKSLEDMQAIFSAGVEKIALNTAAIENPDLLASAAARFGSQSLVAAIDVRKTLLGKHQVWTRSGTRNTGRDPVQMARELESRGAGEILLNSIDRDGTRSGYDLDLVERVASSVKVPVVALGGAGGVDDLARAVKQAGASAVAAGSLFVFHGKHRAVLINVPPPGVLEEAFA